MFQGIFNGVLRKFQGREKLHGCFKNVTRKIEGCFKSVLREFKGCFKGVS